MTAEQNHLKTKFDFISWGNMEKLVLYLYELLSPRYMCLNTHIVFISPELMVIGTWGHTCSPWHIPKPICWSLLQLTTIVFFFLSNPHLDKLTSAFYWPHSQTSTAADTKTASMSWLVVRLYNRSTPRYDDFWHWILSLVYLNKMCQIWFLS